jgi:putative addiction module component (TIGR02574 family)
VAQIRQILDQALDLPVAQRARVAEALLRSLDEEPPDDPDQVARAWGDEIERRVEEVRSGRVKTIPWSAVKKDMDRAIKTAQARRRRRRR